MEKKIVPNKSFIADQNISFGNQFNLQKYRFPWDDRQNLRRPRNSVDQNLQK